jgi:DNA-binding SARP family transcriptional activator
VVTEWVHTLAGRADDARSVILHLFGGAYVTVDRCRIPLPEGSKRLLVFVALHNGRVDRRYAAGTLWPIGDDVRAAGNLRSAIWRLRRSRVPLMSTDRFSLWLRDEVVVDLDVVGRWAGRLIDGSASAADLAIKPWGIDALDLLPGWYEDWALLERERVRQRILHALEALSVALVRGGRCGEAVDAAMIAVCSEPLRESAQRALIGAHIADGNWVEGKRRFEAYRRLLHREIGTEPHPSLADLLRKAIRFERALEGPSAT